MWDGRYEPINGHAPGEVRASAFRRIESLRTVIDDTTKLGSEAAKVQRPSSAPTLGEIRGGSASPVTRRRSSSVLENLKPQRWKIDTDPKERAPTERKESERFEAGGHDHKFRGRKNKGLVPLIILTEEIKSEAEIMKTTNPSGLSIENRSDVLRLRGRGKETRYETCDEEDGRRDLEEVSSRDSSEGYRARAEYLSPAGLPGTSPRETPEEYPDPKRRRAPEDAQVEEVKMIPECPEIVKRRRNPSFSAGGIALISIGLLALAVALLAGCSGPSRNQYAILLHECRESNREHLRLYKACEERLVVNGVPVPEQSRGSAEMGLGGY